MTADMSHTALRNWARGSHRDEAGVEFLIRAFGGRFAGAGYPWIRSGDHGEWWVEWETITGDAIGALSGGEQRLLRLVASIGGGRPVNLADALAGLDRGVLQLVLAAIAHAAGSHEHSDVRVDDTGAPLAVDLLPPLYPWPRTEHGTR